MELLNKFPPVFFKTPSEIAKPSTCPDDEIIPIKWKNNKTGKKIIVKLANNDRK